MTYIVDQLFPPIKLTDEDDCIEYTSFNYWRDPVCDVDVSDVSNGSTPPPDTSLQAIQSKPLATIPENWSKVSVAWTRNEKNKSLRMHFQWAYFLA